jgi:Ca-activated chloride channel family protein
MTQVGIAIAAGVFVALIVAIAELLHTRRVSRVKFLAFGPDAEPRRWTRVVGPLRSVCLGAFVWAFVTLVLVKTGAFASAPAAIGSETRNVVFIADLSPSMYLTDSGVDGALSRRARMAEVFDGLLERVGGDVTFTVIGFYTDALPVVSQVRDREVARNVFNDLPLVYAMGPGETNLGLSIQRSMGLIETFYKDSSYVFICTDGDSEALTQAIAVPPSVNRVTVLGIGDPNRPTFIDGRQSKQDPNTLRMLASMLGGNYYDVNTRHVPTSELDNLIVRQGSGDKLDQTALSLLVMGLAATTLAFIPVAQQYGGTRWRILMPTRTAQEAT